MFSDTPPLSDDDYKRIIDMAAEIRRRRDEANAGRSRDYADLDKETLGKIEVIMQRPHGYDRVVTTSIAVPEKAVLGISVIEERKRLMKADLVYLSFDDVRVMRDKEYTSGRWEVIDEIGKEHPIFGFLETGEPKKLYPVLLFHEDALSTREVFGSKATSLDPSKVISAFDFRRDGVGYFILRRFYVEPFSWRQDDMPDDSHVVAVSARNQAVDVVADVISRAGVRDILPCDISPIVHDMRDEEFARARLRVTMGYEAQIES